MSSESELQPAGPARSSPWLHSRAFWAVISIIAMWLAVLFVGIFGGDFVSSSTNGFTKIPVVVFLLPFVLPATVVVARRGFTSDAAERAAAREESPQTREESPTNTSTLRPTPA
jgi:hypothetical protein